jgi:hypothetical protein
MTAVSSDIRVATAKNFRALWTDFLSEVKKDNDAVHKPRHELAT